jgi:hypothetical protein
MYECSFRMARFSAPASDGPLGRASVQCYERQRRGTHAGCASCGTFRAFPLPTCSDALRVRGWGEARISWMDING